MNEWIFPYLKRFKWQFIRTLFVGILGVLSGALLLFISGYLITKSALRPENIMVVYVPIVAVRAFSIAQAVFLYLDRLSSHELVLRILEKMRRRLYDLIEPQALALQSKYQTGDLLAVLSEDIERLQDFYLKTILPSAIGILAYVGIIAVVGSFDLTFALFSAALLGVVTLLIPFLSWQRLKLRYLEQKNITRQLYTRLTDALFGRIDWQASRRTDELFDQIATTGEHWVQNEKRRNRFQRSRDLVTQLLFGSFIATMIYWTSDLAMDGKIEPTLIAAFVLMTVALADVFNPLAQAAEETSLYTDSLARIQEVTKQTDTPILQDADLIEEPQLTISHVDFKYEIQKTLVLNDVSLDIPFGKKIALLGRSGSGKSTLIQLISGLLQPQAGAITLNDVPVSESQIGKTIGILNQKPHLFQTTIRNNIVMGNEQCTEADLLEAVDRAQLTPLIKSLPLGLNTPMDEMGKRFSGGERQRIAFARVLLQNTPIVILDEPTIGLDLRTEQQLLETMFTALHDRTIVLVTHHLTNVHLLDELIFLKDGKVHLQGTHEQLLSTSPYYQRLCALDQHGFN